MPNCLTYNPYGGSFSDAADMGSGYDGYTFGNINFTNSQFSILFYVNCGGSLTIKCNNKSTKIITIRRNNFDIATVNPGENITWTGLANSDDSIYMWSPFVEQYVPPDTIVGQIYIENPASPSPTVTSTPTPTPPPPTPSPTPIPTETLCNLIPKCISIDRFIPLGGFFVEGLCPGIDGYGFYNDQTEGQIQFNINCVGDLHVEISNTNKTNTAFVGVAGDFYDLKNSNINITKSVLSNDSVTIQYLRSTSPWKTNEIFGRIYFLQPTPTPTPFNTPTPTTTSATPTPTPTATSNTSCACLSAKSLYGDIATGASNCELLFEPGNILSSKYEDFFSFLALCNGYVEILYSATQRFEYKIYKNGGLPLVDVITIREDATGQKLIDVTAGDLITVELFAENFVYEDNQFAGKIIFTSVAPSPTPTPSATPHCGISLNPGLPSWIKYNNILPCTYTASYTQGGYTAYFTVLEDGYVNFDVLTSKSEGYFQKNAASFFGWNTVEIDKKYTKSIQVNVGDSLGVYLAYDADRPVAKFNISLTWTTNGPTPTPSPTLSSTPMATAPTPTPTPTKAYYLLSYGLNNEAQCGTNYGLDLDGVLHNVTLFAPSNIPWQYLGKIKNSGMAIKSNGSLFVWGSNYKYKLGYFGSADSIPVTTPIQIISNKKFVSAIDCEDHSLYLTSDGDIWGSGKNTYGALGNNTTVHISSPVMLISGGSNPWVKIDGSKWFSAGMKSDGTLWSWGANFAGQLGINSTENKSSPTFVSTLYSYMNWLDFSCGSNFMIGKVFSKNNNMNMSFSWGANGQGQLGNDTTEPKSSPSYLAINDDWTAISTGDDNVFGHRFIEREKINKVYSWGGNAYKKSMQDLGTPLLTTNKSIPTQVKQYSTWSNAYTDNFNTGKKFSCGDLNTAILDIFGYESIAGKERYSLKNPNKTFSYRLADLSMGNGFLLGIPTDYQVPIPTPQPTLPCINLEEKINLESESYIDSFGSGYKWYIPKTSYETINIKYTLNCDGAEVRISGKSNLKNIKGTIKIYYTNTSYSTYNFDYWDAVDFIHTSSSWNLVDITITYLGDQAFVGGAEGLVQIVNIPDPPTQSPYPTQFPTPTPTETPPPTPLPTYAGYLVVWGVNQDGQLGKNDTEARSQITQLGTDKNWLDMAAGYSFNIARNTDEKIVSWGKNDDGQLGLDDKIDRSSPLQIVDDKNWIAINAGANNALGLQRQPATQTPPPSPTPTPTATPCASSPAGLLYVKGNNNDGKLFLGRSDREIINYTLVPPDNIGWKKLSMSAYNFGGIKLDGTLWMCGNGTSGQLGNGEAGRPDGVNNFIYINRSSPVQEFHRSNDWDTISVGSNRTAAIKYDGSLWVWGFGQLGINNHNYISISIPVQTVCKTYDWKDVSNTEDFTIALKKDNTIWTFGGNYFGRLGDNTTIHRSSPVQECSLSNNWSKIYAGTNNGAAIKSDGTLWLWGKNYAGELGCNNIISMSSPVQEITQSTTWNFVSLTDQRTVAIKTDGSLWGWGEILKNNYSSPIQLVPGSDGWLTMEAKSFVGLKADNNLYELKNPLFSDPDVLSPVLAASICGTTWSDAAIFGSFYSGWSDSIGLLSGPKLTPMPSPSFTVTPTRTPIPTPTPTPTYTPGPTPMPTQIRSPLQWWLPNKMFYPLKDDLFTSPLMRCVDKNSVWVDISYQYGVKSDGTLWKWKNSWYNPQQDYLTQIGTDNNWSTCYTYNFISDNVFGIKKDGSMWAYGKNRNFNGLEGFNGIFGNGSTNDATNPIQIGNGTSDWKFLSVGLDHCAGIKNDGKLYSWGQNHVGQLGNDSRNSSLSPVQESNGFTDWIEVSCGLGITIGIRYDGTLWGWGKVSLLPKNDYDLQFSLSRPVQIKSIYKWQSVSCCSYSMNILLNRDGQIFVFGDRRDNPDFNRDSFRGEPVYDRNLDKNYIYTTNRVYKIKHFWQASDPVLFPIRYGGMALDVWGKLSVWGYNLDGELGTGLYKNIYTPIRPSPFDDNWRDFHLRPPVPTPTPTASPTAPIASPTPTPTYSENTCLEYHPQKYVNIGEEYIIETNHYIERKSFTYGYTSLPDPNDWRYFVSDTLISTQCDGYYEIWSDTSLPYGITIDVKDGAGNYYNKLYYYEYYKNKTVKYKLKAGSTIRMYWMKEDGNYSLNSGYTHLKVERIFPSDYAEFIQDQTLCGKLQNDIFGEICATTTENQFCYYYVNPNTPDGFYDRTVYAKNTKYPLANDVYFADFIQEKNFDEMTQINFYRCFKIYDIPGGLPQNYSCTQEIDYLGGRNYLFNYQERDPVTGTININNPLRSCGIKIKKKCFIRMYINALPSNNKNFWNFSYTNWQLRLLGKRNPSSSFSNILTVIRDTSEQNRFIFEWNVNINDQFIIQHIQPCYEICGAADVLIFFYPYKEGYPSWS